MRLITNTLNAYRIIGLLCWIKLATTLCISFLPSFAVAQSVNQNPDFETQLDHLVGASTYSLDQDALKKIAEQISKTNEFDTYIRAQGNLILWQGLEKIQADEAIRRAYLLYQEARQRDSKNGQAEMLAVQCEIMFQHGRVDEYMKLLPELERHLEQVDSPRLLFNINLLISKLWQTSTQQELAVKYALKAQDAAGQIKDRFQLQRRLQLNMHIARTESALRHYAAAAELLDSSIKEAKQNKEFDQLAELYLLSGFAYRHKNGPTDRAISLYQQAVDWARRTNNLRVQLMALNNIGASLLLQQKYPQAQQYLQQAREILPKDEMASDRLVIDFNLAYLQVLQGNHQTGIQVMVEKTEEYRKVARSDQVANLLTHLADAYGKTGQYQNQVAVLTEKLQLLNKYYSDERARVANEMQMRYKSNEQALQVELLNQRLEIQQHQNENQKHLVWMGFGLGFATLIVLSITFYSYRRIKFVNKLLSEKNEQLHQLSQNDPLTGLKNRRAISFPAKSGQQPEDPTYSPRRRLSDKSALLVLIDIDRFKSINDTYGHAVGDEVLLAFSSRLKQFCRSNDQILRWGGEEFLILLADIDASHAINTINRLLEMLCGKSVETGAGTLNISASGGFLMINSTTPQDEELWNWQVKFADLLLYRGKDQGRNRLYGWLAAPEHHAQSGAEEQFAQIIEILEIVMGPDRK